MMDIQAWVPQGSRLGPLLFIIYINDIVEGLESEILIFADAVLTLFNSYLSNRKQSGYTSWGSTRIKAWTIFIYYLYQ